jgi:hypothetical protein
MRTRVKTVRPLMIGDIFPYLAGIIFISILYFVAGLSLRQAIVLGLMFWLYSYLLSTKSSSQASTCKPFWVRVDPQWHDILMDFKLISSTEEWHALLAASKQISNTTYSPIRDSIRFSVLGDSTNHERRLIYFNNFQVFGVEINFFAELDSVSVRRSGQAGELIGEEKISFYLKRGLEGYDFGIRVPAWWWKETGSNRPTILSEREDALCGRIDVVLATIPYEEFHIYWQSESWSQKFIDKQDEVRQERRAKLGWKVVEHPETEIYINWPYEFESRYCHLRHDEL